MSIDTGIRLLKNRRTKIIATLGPSSASADVIKQLMKAGANVFRLNMSHGSHAEHEYVYHLIRDIAEQRLQPIAILVDLCGPKIRAGKFKDGAITLENNAAVTVTSRDVVGEANIIPTQYEGLVNDVKKGNRILMNDGNLELEVKNVAGSEVSCKVIRGGVLKNHSGINLPGIKVSAPSLTDKDRDDARFALHLGVDFLALSFVRNADDVEDLKEIIRQTNSHAGIIAKIERQEAVEDIVPILNAADGIMVARGDLGVEMRPEQVPVMQNQLINAARKQLKPVIVATQMLESMVENSTPTRAEVTDISYAVTLGADAVMLSAESAVGHFPVQSVRMMDRILRQTESHLWQEGEYNAGIENTNPSLISVFKSMANATNNLASELMAHAIIVFSKSGISAITMVAARPAAPVVVVSNRISVYRKMALIWGTIPVLAKDNDSTDHLELAKRIAIDLHLATTGDAVLLVRGFHPDPELSCPSVTVLLA